MSAQHQNHLSELFIKAAIISFVFITVSVQLLSLFHAIKFIWIAASAVLYLTVISAYIYYNFKEPVFVFNHKYEYVMAGFIGLILITTLFTALAYPPTNYDSMTYHMARVSNWINNQSIEFYPVLNQRQNYQPPLAEYTILFLQILTGSDIFANCVQWFCFAGCIALAYLITGEFFESQPLQLLAAFIASTIPMAILQASSTQNDLVVSFFIMAFALFMIKLKQEFSAGNVIFCGLSLALALMTKGTALIYCAAIGICLAMPLLRSNKRIKYATVLSAIVLFALIFNSGLAVRNYKMYNDPLSPDSGQYRNEKLALFSGLIRNAAMHLGVNSPELKKLEHELIFSILGDELNDPQTTWKGSSFASYYSRHEDTAGNAIHMLLLLFIFVTIPFWIKKVPGDFRWYFSAVFAGFVLFCLILKWQPWCSRLHTPFFMLGSVIIPGVLARSFKPREYFLFLIVLFSYSIPFLVLNQSRNLVSLDWLNKDRNELMFNDNPGLYQDHLATAKFIRQNKIKEAGLITGIDDWEYPIWVMNKNVKINNKVPEYIISTVPTIPPGYFEIFSSHNIRILQKQ
jgi:4-amino-4-deoxy-L-arabinose transferase-like glycosyltransferase